MISSLITLVSVAAVFCSTRLDRGRGTRIRPTQLVVGAIFAHAFSFVGADKPEKGRKVCCCKAVQERAECESSKGAQDDSLYTESRSPENGNFCCVLRPSCKGRHGYSKRATTVFSSNSFTEEEKTYIGSAAGLCLVDYVGHSDCNGHEDCDGRLEVCALRQCEGCEASARRCIPIRETRLTCIEALQQLKWVFLLTTSGGGGHIAAAKSITSRVNEKIKAKAMDFLQGCDQQGVDRDELRRAAHKAVKLATRQSFAPFHTTRCCCKVVEKRRDCPETSAVFIEDFTKMWCCKKRWYRQARCDRFVHVRGYTTPSESVWPTISASRRLVLQREESLCNIADGSEVRHGMSINGAVVSLNVMESHCMKLAGYQAGAALASKWDDAMRDERFSTLEYYAGMSWVHEKGVHYLSDCQAYLRLTIEDVASQYFGGTNPGYLVDTQPFHKVAIAGVANDLRLSSVEVFLTDFPSDVCPHFAQPLKRLAHRGGWSASHVRVHTPQAPMEKLEAWFGLNRRQYVFEKNLPIGSEFYDPALRLPGEAASIRWKAQVVGEEKGYAFLGAEIVKWPNMFEVRVRPQDRVGLIMLGSVPPRDTVVNMVQHMVDLGLWQAGIRTHGSPFESLRLSKGPRDHSVDASQAWLFVACGRKTENVDETGLYYAVLAEVLDYEERLNQQFGVRPASALHIVPFTGQPAILAYARADVAIIKTGGLSAAEALALVELDRNTRRLERRSQPKALLMNCWSGSRGVAQYVHSRSLPVKAESWKDVQDAIVRLGQVAHERGNARYLMNATNAEAVCVRPSVRQLVNGGGFRERKAAEVRGETQKWFALCDGPFLQKMDAQLFGQTESGERDLASNNSALVPSAN